MKIVLCPYCGHAQQHTSDRCGSCGGYFDLLSRRVTQQYMGPWFVRDEENPFQPGRSYDVLSRDIARGKLKPTTILRGPTTRQFWALARNVPGISHLLGYCWKCGEHVPKESASCPKCAVRFTLPSIRDQLGLEPLDPTVLQLAAQARTQKQSGDNSASGSGMNPAVDISMLAEDDPSTIGAAASLLASLSDTSGIAMEVPTPGQPAIASSAAPAARPPAAPPSQPQQAPKPKAAIEYHAAYVKPPSKFNSQTLMIILLVVVNVALIGGFIWYLIDKQDQADQPIKPSARSNTTIPGTNTTGTPTPAANTPVPAPANEPAVPVQPAEGSTPPQPAPPMPPVSGVAPSSNDLPGLIGDPSPMPKPLGKPLPGIGVGVAPSTTTDDKKISFFGVDANAAPAAVKAWLEKFKEAQQLEKDGKLPEALAAVRLIMNNLPEKEWPKELIEARDRLSPKPQ